MIDPSRLAANVAWLFTEMPWPDRFAAAREAGFAQVEFPWPADPDETAAAVVRAGIRVALLNMDAGDLDAGERGWPNDPARVDEWREAFRRALDLAQRVGAPVVNVLAGNAVQGVPLAGQLACFEANLRWGLPVGRSAGTTLVTELLNAEENPRYLLTALDAAAPMVERLASLGWRLQLDTWHLGLAGLDIPAAIRTAGSAIGHVQVADVPGRHEPGTGALDWRAIWAALDHVGYGGAIGFEYRPTRAPTPTLG